VDVASQTLRLFDERGQVAFETRIATARNGTGEARGSEKTPRGAHTIRAKIGAGLPPNAVLVSRRFTGEIYSPALRAAYPGRDWILTRILWLSGLEPGKNRLGEVDTMRRYIYLHGCPDEDPVGVPSSRGCIKLRNQDIIRLFDLVEPGTPVLIKD
jgi:lipoprotein-anchoring transpeptidase ErfK/SrfK